jgi:hypothetical protein
MMRKADQRQVGYLRDSGKTWSDYPCRVLTGVYVKKKKFSTESAYVYGNEMKCHLGRT